MSSNYQVMIQKNLKSLFDAPPPDLESRLGAEKEGDGYALRAFGENAWFDQSHVLFDGIEDPGPKGLLITLYATHASSRAICLKPYQAFKDFPGSMPYHGAFAANSERVLVPHVEKIRGMRADIIAAFNGTKGEMGDFSMVLYPLPKIALSLIFYRADDEFPPSATCLFSANALSFMPLDGLADVGEYTARKIIELVC